MELKFIHIQCFMHLYGITNSVVIGVAIEKKVSKNIHYALFLTHSKTIFDSVELDCNFGPTNEFK